jgi:hypothetical protein
MGAIEDHDLAVRRHAGMASPQEIVRKLLGRGCLERPRARGVRVERRE